MKESKVLSLLSLAEKAGKVKSGEFMTEKTVKSRGAFLVFVAKDASENTRKKFTDMCAYYQVPIYLFSNKAELGHAIGKEFRASLAVADEGLAKAMEKQLKEMEKAEVSVWRK